MYEKKNDYIIVLVVLLICIAAGWLYADYHRNSGEYHHTDCNVERIEKRLDDIGQRVDGLRKRNAENQRDRIHILPLIFLAYLQVISEWNSKKYIRIYM